MRPGDKIVYAAVVSLFAISAAISGAVFYIDRSAETLMLEVISDGMLDREIVLNTVSAGASISFAVETMGGTNVFEISGGAVRVVSSDCSGGDCLRTPAISRHGEVIVCLPHRLILRITGGAPDRSKPTDAVSR